MEDHGRLAKVLAAMPCGAVVTYYATPEIRMLYPAPLWEHHLIEATKNSMKATGEKQKVHELILVKRAEVKRLVAKGRQMSLGI